jgi:hypothetical protein
VESGKEKYGSSMKRELNIGQVALGAMRTSAKNVSQLDFRGLGMDWKKSK